MPIRVLEKDKSKNDRNDQAKQQSAMAQKQETPKPQKLNSKGSEKANEPKSPSARRDERKAEQREQRIMLREYGMKRGGLKGNQKKLDKNNNNRIDAQDFKILKAEKAKDRGMGLQDEKMKPGKVMKADKGEFIKRRKEIAKGFGKTFGVFPKINKQSMGQAKDYKKYLEGLKQATMDKKANKALDKGKKIIGKGGRIGAAAAILGLAGAGAASLGQKIGRKLDEVKNKKMGGGMMMKPTGYKSGTPKGGVPNLPSFLKDEEGNPIPRKKKGPQRSGNSRGSVRQKQDFVGMRTGRMVKARGCKLGRNKPTKIT